jgi:P27 family predicted phage terminase small subunit
MAQRGRKPKPVAAKIAAGNPGKRPLTTLVPAPRAAGEMMCPQSVQRNERARTYWDIYLANAAPGHLTAIDAPLLARLCTALAYADDANEKIETTGLMVRAPNTGLPLQSPYLAVLNRQTEIARKLAAELALPPAQRNRVGPYDASAAPSAWDALEG